LRGTASYSYEPSCVKIGSVVFAVGDDKKKMEVKERKGKVQKVTKALYFTYSWGSPLWTDFNQILHFRRYAGRKLNHLCKFWYGKIERFGKYGGSNFGLSHWNDWLPSQQCCATAQPV